MVGYPAIEVVIPPADSVNGREPELPAQLVIKEAEGVERSMIKYW